MGVLPLVLLGLLSQVYAGPSNAVSVGNSHWGFALELTVPLRECTPMRFYYNVTLDEDPPDWVELPYDARIEFLLPDSSQDVWMVIQPPMGRGVLSWTVPLRQNKQVVIRNSQGYEQVFTVGSPTDGTSCGQDATQVTTSSPFGNIYLALYNRLRSTSFAPYSVQPDSQFRSKEFEANSSPNTGTINLGAALPGTSGTTPNPQPGGASSDDGSGGGSGSSSTPDTNGSETTSDPVDGLSSTRGVSEGTTSGSPPGQTDSKGQTDAPGTRENVSSPNTSGIINPGQSGDGPGGGSGDPGNGGGASTSGGANIGAIIGGIIGALAAGVLFGALCVVLNRRRRRKLRNAVPLEIRPLSPVIETDESIAATGGSFSGPDMLGVAAYSSDRKNPALFEDDNEGSSHRNSLGTTTWSGGQHSYFGGVTDFPSTTDRHSRSGAETVYNNGLSVPPPKYSRFG